MNLDKQQAGHLDLLSVTDHQGSLWQHLVDGLHDPGARPVLVRGEESLEGHDKDQGNGEGKVGHGRWITQWL